MMAMGAATVGGVRVRLMMVIWGRAGGGSGRTATRMDRVSGGLCVCVCVCMCVCACLPAWLVTMGDGSCAI